MHATNEQLIGYRQWLLSAVRNIAQRIVSRVNSRAELCHSNLVREIIVHKFENNGTVA